MLLCFIPNILGQCNISGQCSDSTFLLISTATDVKNCLKFCHDTPRCSWVTFMSNSNLCIAFASCDNISNVCQDCSTSKIDCLEAEKKCGAPGKCLGIPLKTFEEIDSDECLKRCKQDQGCKWFNYEGENKTCSELGGCVDIEPSCGDTVVGKADCDLYEEGKYIETEKSHTLVRKYTCCLERIVRR